MFALPIEEEKEKKRGGASWLVIAGLLLIGLGIIYFLAEIFHVGWIWGPAAMLLVGIVLIVWALLSRAGLVEEKH